MSKSIVFKGIGQILLVTIAFSTYCPWLVSSHGQLTGLTTRLVSSYGTVSQLPFLYGVNVFDWENWTEEQVDRELMDIHNCGFNFIRIPVYFSHFVDMNTLEFNVSRNPDYYRKLFYFMNGLEKMKFLVEPVPMEPWKFGDQMDFWWTNSILQKRIAFFYRTYAQWLKSTGYDNVVYLTVWWEATYYFEWTDGACILQNGYYCYNETNEDWKNWLSQQGLQPVDLTIDHINEYLDQYITWSRDRFNLITKIKAEAIREGWSSCRLAGEIGYSMERPGTGAPYHASRYLQLCAEPYLDVLCEHDYFDTISWALEPYVEAIQGKPVVINEIGGPAYLNAWANNTNEWWSYLEPKLEFVANQTKGFAIWCWKDYDDRPFGLKDMNFNPRPVLQLVSNWLSRRESTGS